MNKHVKNPLLIIVALGMVLASVQVGWTADNEDQNLVTGWDLLQQKKYAEARAALEAGVKSNPGNAYGQFYLAEACRGLKDWACAEEHYDTSLELDSKSSVAALAKQRSRKAKVWRLLDQGEQAISESNRSSKKLAKAKDKLDIAKKLGLNDEQEAVYEQLQEKLRIADEPRLAKERERLAAEQQARQREEEAKREEERKRQTEERERAAEEQRKQAEERRKQEEAQQLAMKQQQLEELCRITGATCRPGEGPTLDQTMSWLVTQTFWDHVHKTRKTSFSRAAGHICDLQARTVGANAKYIEYEQTVDLREIRVDGAYVFGNQIDGYGFMIKCESDYGIRTDCILRKQTLTSGTIVYLSPVHSVGFPVDAKETAERIVKAFRHASKTCTDLSRS